MDEGQIMEIMEDMIKQIFRTHLQVDLGEFPRLSHADAMRLYGSDKPDLRIDLQLVDIEELMRGVEFKVFSGPASDGASRVVALRVPGGASLSRKSIDDLTKFVAIYGAKGLAWIKVNDAALGIEGLQSPIIKFIGAGVTQALMQKLAVETGDIIFFGADKRLKWSMRPWVPCGYGLLKSSVWLPTAGLRCGWLIFRCSKRAGGESYLTASSLHRPFCAGRAIARKPLSCTVASL